MEKTGGDKTAASFTLSKEIPISLEGKEIAERLKKKSLEVKIIAVRHVGHPSEKVVDLYGKPELRTIEETWGSIDDYINPLGPSPKNSVEEMLVGLGPHPKFPMELVKTKRFGTPEGLENDYFEQLEAKFNDVRGVDQAISNGWVNAILKDKVSVPTLQFPGLSPDNQAKLTKDTIIHLLNAHRDKVQAFCIAKILDLHTHNKDRASLIHLGGINHIALPVILKESYGISPEVIHVNEEKPAKLRMLLGELLPPNIALQLIGEIGSKGFTYQSEEIQLLLTPHLPEFKSLLEQS